MMRIRGTLYGMCYPCATTHMVGTACPKNNPEFDILDIPDDDDEDEEETYSQESDQEESEN